MTLTRLLLILLTALSCAGCTGLFFYPSRELVRTPADIGLRYEEVRVGEPDSGMLTGWYLPAAGAPKGTVIFLHGNAENISTHFGQIYWLPAAGYQVFIYDYSGYGSSDGAATVDGVHADAALMVRAVLADPRVDPARLFLMGQSLGAAVALYTAAQPEFRQTFRAVVADSPFSSYRRIAREKLDGLWLTALFQWPLGFLVDDRRSPDRVVAEITVPVLFIHGTADEVVPPHHSADLCTMLENRCTRLEVPGAVHGQPMTVPEVREKVVEFLGSAQ